MKFSRLDMKSMSMEIWKPYQKVSINKETKILNQKFNKNQMIKVPIDQKKKKDLIIIITGQNLDFQKTRIQKNHSRKYFLLPTLIGNTC